MDILKQVKSNQTKENIEKLLRVLEKIDSSLFKSGIIQYQERIHHIAKTLRSIEEHSGLYCSKFTLNDEEDKELTLLDQKRFYENFKKQENEFCTVEKSSLHYNKEGKNISIEMNELIEYIESKLLYDNDQTTLSSNSSVDSDQDQSAKAEEKPKKGNFEKNFFNVELRMRAFIKQQQQANLLNTEDFESFMNQTRLKTPMKNTAVKPNPSIIKNFFEDCIDISKFSKRLTLDQLNLRSIFEVGKSSKRTVQSEQVKISTSQPVEKKVSKFEDILEEEPDREKDFSDFSRRFSKRGSIWRKSLMYSQEGDVIKDTDEERVRNAESFESEISEENDEEYETVEEEVEVDEEGNEI